MATHKPDRNNMTVKEAKQLYKYMQPDGIYCDGKRKAPAKSENDIIKYFEVSDGIVYYHTTAAPAPAKPVKECTLSNVKKITGLHFTTKHTGKMEGMISLSTAVTTSERCKKNAEIKGSICEKCYASTMMKRYPTMKTPMEKNQEILTAEILPFEKLPRINALYFRFESFGDLNNDIQVINYFNLCYKNPNVKFALWTKNPDYIEAAISQGYKKPENLNIVLSSLFINKERKIVHDFVDKVFTVYDKKHASENDVNINCGAKSCFSCGLCYNKNGVKVVNEILK